MTNSQHALTPQTVAIVAIPTLNEADHIETVVQSLAAGVPADDGAEFWVVDGGSDDGTTEIVRTLAAVDSRIRLLHNPQRTQASAVNLAADRAQRRGGVRYLIRADAHALYPQGWVKQLIATATQTGADSVVVPMKTRGGGAMRDASADLFNSWLGNGGSPHRMGRTRGFVEHGHHALFRLDAFVEAGGYDPLFLANEDAELDVRLRERGRRIYLESRAGIDYVPRASLAGVCRQFFRNGRYRLCTCLKHGRRLGLRQLAPMVLAAALIGSAIAGVAIHPLLLAPLALYAVAVLAASALVASEKAPRRIVLIATTAMTAHVAFGLGALKALAAYLGNRRVPFAAGSVASAGIGRKSE